MFIIRLTLVCILFIPCLAQAENTSPKQVLINKFHSQFDTYRTRIRVLDNLEASRLGSTSSRFKARILVEQSPLAKSSSLFHRLIRKMRPSRKDRTHLSSALKGNSRKKRLLASQQALAAFGRNRLKVLPRIEETAAAVASNRSGEPRVTPVQALQDGVAFIKVRVKKTIPKNLDIHAAVMRNQKTSRALHKEHSSLSGLNLEQRLPGTSAAAMAEVVAHLRQIEAHPSHSWLSRLVRVINSYQQHERGASKALLRLWYMLLDEYGGKGPFDKHKMQETYLKELSARLISHPPRKAARALPQTLPPLPRSNQRAIRRLIGRARQMSTIQGQLLFLETEAMKLRSSESDKRLSQGKALTTYLAEYKKPWLDNWLAGRLGRFSRQPTSVSWSLRSDVRCKNQHSVLSDVAKHQVEERLEEAWRIITAVVHPDLLRRVPAPIVLVESNRTRAAHNGKTLKIGPKTLVTSILHEFGHHLEQHAGVGLFSLAHSMRQERAFMNGVLKPRENYPKELLYPGSFHEEYAGRHYPFGSTEMVSKGLEKFGSKEALREFFLQDGQFALRLLAAIQHPETLGVPF